MAQIEMLIDSLRRGLVNNGWVVLLREKLAERYLPIYIVPSQADILRRELLGTEPDQPAGSNLSLAGVGTTESKLESVIINRFENNVFYAKLLLCRHDKSYEVDCPPAKALALAVREGVPILAEEAILKKAGVGAQPCPKVISYSDKVTNHPKS